MIDKFIIGLIAVITLAGCGNSRNQQPGVTGEIDGAEGETAYLERYVDNKPQVIDSAVISESGAFFIPMSADMALDYYRLRIGDDKTLILLTDSTEKLFLAADLENLETPTKIEGSENSVILNNFQEKMKDYASQTDSLQQVFQGADVSQERKSQIKAKYIQVLSEKNEYVKNFIDQNLPRPASMAGLSQLDLATDMDYYEKVAEALEKNFGHSYYYDMIATQMESFKKQQKLKELGQVERPEKNSKYSVGMMAPNIEMTGPDGKMRSLEDLRGQYVLIDFWASWCGPCRRENPNLVKTYQKYKDDGFTVFSVSFDKTKDRWVQAIEQDNLTWPHHVSDLKGWDNEAGREYGISSIPHTILLDKKGEIIATKLRGSALDNKLKEVFGH